MGIMTKMRTQMHVVLWSLLILFLLSITVGGLVGGANILDQIFGRINPGEAIGAVNGEIITPDFFERSVSERLNYYQVPGQDLSEGQLHAIREETWNSVVQDFLIRQAIEEFNIKVSNEEVIYHLRNNPPQLLTSQPVFQTNGIFDMAKYQQALDEPAGIDWYPIEEYLRNVYIPYFKLQSLITSSELVTGQEVREEFIKTNTVYTVDGIHVTRQALDVSAFQPSEEDIKAAYHLKRDELDQPERRSIQFVTWEKKPVKLDTLEVYNNAIEIRNMARSGQSFSELADLYSEDPGNMITPDSGRGGDLGWFTENQMVRPFAEAAFSVNPGDLVGPVLSQFGYHIIKVYDRRSGDRGDEVHAAHILLKITMGPATRDKLSKAATIFSYDAQDFGFDVALDSSKMTAQTSAPFYELAQFIPGIGDMRSAVRFAFNNPAGSVSDPFENDRLFAVVVVDTIIPEGKTSLEDASAGIENEIINERIMDASLIFASELKDAVTSGTTLEDLSRSNSRLSFIQNKSFTVNQGLPVLGQGNFLAGALLNASRDEIIGPVETLQGHALVHVRDISPFDSVEFNTQKDLIYTNLLSGKKNSAFRAWISQKQADAEIVDNRKYYY